jgi:NACalpha-BTF3-like transcription factor
MNIELLKSNLIILYTISKEYNLRLTYAAIAFILDHDDISLINELTGVSRTTISKGIKELK